MLVQFLLSFSARSTNASWFRSITRIDFINGTVNCVFAHAEKLTNFVYAAFTQGDSFSSEILSLLVFIERRHKQLLLGCKHFWRSFRNHLKYRRKVFKVTKFSPVLQLYLFDSQVFNCNFSAFLRCEFFPIVRTSNGENACPKKFKLFFNTYYIIMAYSASYMYKYIILYYGLVVNVCMIANKNSLSDYYVFPYRCRWA